MQEKQYILQKKDFKNIVETVERQDVKIGQFIML